VYISLVFDCILPLIAPLYYFANDPPVWVYVTTVAVAALAAPALLLPATAG
jgi:hypothetical protein